MEMQLSDSGFQDFTNYTGKRKAKIQRIQVGKVNQY